MNDPFKNFKPLNNQLSPQKKKTQTRGDSFVEQIKGIGSSTISSLKNDVVKGTARSIFDQLLSSTKSADAPPENQPNSKLFEKWLREREEQVAENAKSEERSVQKTKRSPEKLLFSYADEQLKQEIGEVRQELATLIKTMGKVEKQIEQAVMEEIVAPGVYHLNFFKKLSSFLRQMRKNLEDASLWMELSAGRGKRSYYWNQVRKSGTKYSMSQERILATSAG